MIQFIKEFLTKEEKKETPKTYDFNTPAGIREWLKDQKAKPNEKIRLRSSGYRGQIALGLFSVDYYKDNKDKIESETVKLVNKDYNVIDTVKQLLTYLDKFSENSTIFETKTIVLNFAEPK